MGRFAMANSKRNFAIGLVTAPDLGTARKLARAALRAKLAACGNIIPRIESHYWWEGKIHKSAEVLILFKTTQRQLRRLEELVLKEHPYDTPEFIVVSIDQGNERYLRWCEQSVSE
jgi:periplasmic divalent cation tolerance protein